MVGDMSAILVFIQYININIFNIRVKTHFTTFYTNELTFLDLGLTGKCGFRIVTTFYRPTVGNTILHFKSKPLKHTLISVSVGEFTRAKTNWDFMKESNTICAHLVTYPTWSLGCARDIVCKKPQDSLLSGTLASRDFPSKPPLVSQYNRQFCEIKRLVNKYCIFYTHGKWQIGVNIK